MPNLRNSKRRVVRNTLLFASIGIGFVVLAILGATVFSRPFGNQPEWSTLEPMYAPNFAIMIPAIFGAMIMAVITASYGGMGIYKINRLIDVLDEIGDNDMAPLALLSMTELVGITPTIAIINKLIQTKNLEGYEVIGQVGVAKITVQARESDFVKQARQSEPSFIGGDTQNTSQRRNQCDGCGARITERNRDKFCSFCGGKL